MKYARIVAFTGLLACSTPCFADMQNVINAITTDEDGRQDEVAQAVLTHFSEICGHFLGILSNPKDGNNVAPHVGSIVQHIVQIGIAATRTPLSQEKRKALEEELTRMILAQAIAQSQE